MDVGEQRRKDILVVVGKILKKGRMASTASVFGQCFWLSNKAMTNNVKWAAKKIMMFLYACDASGSAFGHAIENFMHFCLSVEMVVQ